MEPSLLPVLQVEGGITINAQTRLNTDYASIKTLVESGVSIDEVARLYKLAVAPLKRRAAQERWLTPTKVEALRKEIAAKQGDIFKRSGKTLNVQEVKAQIWQDRGEKMKEDTYNIVQAALAGVTQEAASRFIKNPKGLLEIVTATRLITGEEKADAAATPGLAVNIAFLRSARPTDVIEAEVVGE